MEKYKPTAEDGDAEKAAPSRRERIKEYIGFEGIEVENPASLERRIAAEIAELGHSLALRTVEVCGEKISRSFREGDALVLSLGDPKTLSLIDIEALIKELAVKSLEDLSKESNDSIMVQEVAKSASQQVVELIPSAAMEIHDAIQYTNSKTKKWVM